VIISTNDLKNGITVIFEDRLVEVVSNEFFKPGKGSSFVRARFRDIKTGQVIDHTFKGPQKIEQAFLDQKEMEYLYRDGPHFYFMDVQTYEQVAVNEDRLEHALPYLKENTRCQFMLHKGEVVRVDVPDVVELKITETTPGVRGDTAQGGSKPATLETGLVVQVPLFVGEGELIRVDTRTGEYLERA
jgi:elongation factor P